MKNIFERIFYWLLVVFMLYLIYELVRRILGGSLGFEELVVGLLVANLGYSFYLASRFASISSKLSEHIGWHKGKNRKGKI